MCSSDLEFFEEITVASLRSLPATREWYHTWQRMCDDLDTSFPDSLELEESDPRAAGGLGRKRPDAWAVNWGSATLYLLEFTRPNDSDPEWDVCTDRYKKTKYQPICDRIRLSMPAWTVETLTFSLGIRGSFNEATWSANLDRFGVSGHDSEVLMLELIDLCIRELSAIYRTHQAAISNLQHVSGESAALRRVKAPRADHKKAGYRLPCDLVFDQTVV